MASITPQISLDPNPSSTLKRSKKVDATEVKISLEVKVSTIELDSDIKKGKQCARRTSRHLEMEKFKNPQSMTPALTPSIVWTNLLKRKDSNRTLNLPHLY